MSADYDGLFRTVAHGTEDGIVGLLEAFFGFLSRQTDFYFGVTEATARDLVLDAFNKHKVNMWIDRLINV